MGAERERPLTGGGVPSSTSDERTWAALAHASALLNLVMSGVGGAIGALVIWLTQKDRSRWVAFHALQSLVFQTALFLVTVVFVGVIWVLGFAFSFATVGFGTFIAVPIMIASLFLAMVLMLGGLVYSLYGAYQVYEGREFRYFWIGDWAAERAFRQ